MAQLIGCCRPFVVLSVMASCFTLQAVAISGARASCGDWLAHPNHAASDGSERAETKRSSSEKPLSTSPTRRACDGPHCQQAPAQPPPVVPLSISAPCSKVGVFVRHAAFLDLRQHFTTCFESDVRAARGFPTRIDHPPRV
jgi:hypothetical protein